MAERLASSVSFTVFLVSSPLLPLADGPMRAAGGLLPPFHAYCVLCMLPRRLAFPNNPSSTGDIANDMDEPEARRLRSDRAVCTRRSW